MDITPRLDSSVPQPQVTRPVVVRIIGRLNIGGPARQACLLHRELRGKFRTVLIAGRLDAQEGDMSYLLAPDEPGVHWVDAMSRPIRLWNDLLSMLAILRLLRRERPAIVHTHTAKAGAVGRVAALFAGVPIIIHTYHGHVFNGYFSPTVSRFFQWIERSLNKRTTRIIAISASQAQELSEVYRVVDKEKIQIIPTGFDFPLRAGTPEAAAARRRLRSELGMTDSDFVILWAGRLVPVKDVELLTEVIRLAAQRLPRVHFLIAGDGVDRKLLLHRTAGLSNLSLLGWRKDINELWHAADCALLTSKNEGTPASLIEAMAAAKPFVTVDVGGVSDLAQNALPDPAMNGVKRSQNCFLTPRDAAAIVGCISVLQDHPDLARSMGEAGARFAIEQHSNTRLVHDIASLYENLLRENAR